MNNIRKKIYQHILDKILDGNLQLGEKIPTELELSTTFKTNRMNAHLAIKELENEGIIKRNKRQGSIVTRKPTSTEALSRKSVNSDIIHILASPDKSFNIHWDEHTLAEFERLLSENGCKTIHKEFPETREELEQLIDDIVFLGSKALVIFIHSGLDIILKNMDVMSRYKGEIFFLNRGNYPVDELPYHVLTLNPFNEGEIAAKYLFEQGFEKIFFLNRKKAIPPYWSEMRKKGLQFGLDVASKNKIIATILEGTPDDIGEKAVAIIKKSKEKIAFAVRNDADSAIFIEYAAKHGLKAPDDFALISFDNAPAYRKYNLTTVAPPINDMAKVLAKMILNFSACHTENSHLVIKVNSRIIIRETC